ncbi:hypothetical protein [Microbacterium sp. SD291]|uniref:hypothetical protein n=1 Tax=Microbacterium sp. SD291 TaxID=2782007 RepID=UPI001A96816E|nr:hypothetical protein [Microbacterium sp. SD291]MBO0981891.1 hypothetical protein [Microbacterium sp. SD291]
MVFMFSLGSGSVDEALAVGDPLRYEFFDAATTPETIVSGRRNEVAGGLHGAPVAHLPKHPAGTCCAETVGVTF